MCQEFGMLLWLRQRLPKKNLFLFKLSILSGLTHLALCFGFFFMYKEYNHALLLQVHATHNPDDVIVRLLPLAAKKPKAKRVAKRAAVSVKKPVKKVSKKKVMQLAQVKKAVPKPKQEVKQKPVVKPEQKKEVEARVSAKKVEPKVEKVVSKPVEKKEIKSVEKKPEIVKTESVPVKEVSKEELKPEPIVEQAEENVRYVTHKELRGIELENAVQAAVQEVWTPPIGVDQEVMSEVQVTVGWDGKLVESKILKLSEIVIYDVAVQEALEDITFPRQVWGKEIKIAFRP